MGKVKKMISNRKISFYVNESDKDLKKEYYKTLNDWFYHARHYANDVVNILQCATVMNNINRSIEGDLSVKLHEFIESSSQNLNYKLLTQKYKPLLPSIFRVSISSNIYKTYGKSIGKILKGEKSVSTFNVGFPLYFASQIFKFESSDKPKSVLPETIRFEDLLKNEPRLRDVMEKFDGKLVRIIPKK